MHSVTELPEGYSPLCTIDLQKNKKLAFGVNFSALLVWVVMICLIPLVCPWDTWFSDITALPQLVLRFAVFAVSMIAYIVLHEAVHGAAMKLCGSKKVRFGFTGLYAFAGSEDYYTKGAYIFIALAPMVLWGIVLTIVCAMLPPSWLWVFYFVQAMNLSGSAGDVYVTLRCLPLPSHILVRDWGTNMIIYSK